MEGGENEESDVEMEGDDEDDADDDSNPGFDLSTFILYACDMALQDSGRTTQRAMQRILPRDEDFNLDDETSDKIMRVHSAMIRYCRICVGRT
jgi:hypothetical protein